MNTNYEKIKGILYKTNVSMGKKVDNEVLANWIEILLMENVDIKLLVVACQQVIMNEQFLNIANINKYMQVQSTTDHVGIVREAIRQYGTNRNRITSAAGEEPSNYQKALDYCEKQGGIVTRALFKQYGDQFGKSETHSTKQTFLIKEMKEEAQSLEQLNKQNPTLLEQKYGSIGIEMHPSVKKQYNKIMEEN